MSKCPDYTGEMRFNCAKYLRFVGTNGDCQDIKNCDFKKQLHSRCDSKSELSQQKTFTVEEVREIMAKTQCKEFYDCGECANNLINEFEKAVG